MPGPDATRATAADGTSLVPGKARRQAESGVARSSLLAVALARRGGIGCGSLLALACLLSRLLLLLLPLNHRLQLGLHRLKAGNHVVVRWQAQLAAQLQAVLGCRARGGAGAGAGRRGEGRQGRLGSRACRKEQWASAGTA